MPRQLVAGDHGRAASAASAAIAAAAAHGWRHSAWTATAHAVLSHASLAQGAPTRALAAAVDGLGVLPAGADPVLRFALRCGRGAALCDVGDRQAGLLELQDAHAERGGERLPAALAAWAALLEDRAALWLGLPTAAASAGSRLSTRENAAAERLLMRSWSEAASGCPGAARATVAPVLTGDLRPLLPSTTVEAWLVEAWGAMRMGDRPAGRSAVQEALALAEPMDLVRPFAVAGPGVRALLVDQLGGVRDPSAFTFRCLTSERRPREPLTTPLSAREQDVLAQLVSLSNLERDRRRPRRLGQHGEEPRPGHLRQAGGEHAPGSGHDGAGALGADVTATADRPGGDAPGRDPAEAVVPQPVAPAAIPVPRSGTPARAGRGELRGRPARRPCTAAGRPRRLRVHPSKVAVPGAARGVHATAGAAAPAGPGRPRPRSSWSARPAGSGKTLLLADWVRQPGGPETAWVVGRRRRRRPAPAVVGGADRAATRCPASRRTAIPSGPAIRRAGGPPADLVDEVVADVLDGLRDADPRSCSTTSTS